MAEESFYKEETKRVANQLRLIADGLESGEVVFLEQTANFAQGRLILDTDGSMEFIVPSPMLVAESSALETVSIYLECSGHPATRLLP